jgi:hypothetical protein
MHEEAMIADLKPASSLIDDQCETIELCRDGPRPLDPVKGRGPGPDPHGPAARGQAGLSIVGRKLHEDSVHGQERRNSHGADGGGLCGRWDADRYDGGGGSVLSGILPADGGAGGEGRDWVKGAR